MIITAVQRGASVFVYGMGNRVLFNITVGTKDALVGYTSSTVSVRRNNMIFTYDEKGRVISNVYGK